MSEDPSYGNFAQFGESQETQAIPPISSFAKRNTRLSTSPGAEECSQPGGFYRELTLEGVDPSVPVSVQSTTAPETMQPQSSQQQQQQQQQHHQQQPQQHPEAEQQYAKAMAAAVAAAYQAHAQEMNNMAATSMVSGSGTGPVITSVTSGQVPPSTSGAVSADVVSPPPLLPMQMQAANSTLLGQALQAANDMGGLPALQLAVQHHQQLQQQQQLLQAVQAAHVQNAGQKMMSPTPTSDQTLNNQGTSSNENEPRDEKTALVNLMPAASLASPVTIQRTDPTNMPTLAPSSQLQTSMSNPLTTSTVNSMPGHVYSMSAATASAPSTNLPAGMINNMSTQVSNLPMGIPSHFMQLNNPQVSMPVPSMLVQAPGPTGQEMISPEQHIMAQGIPNSITNNNDIDMLSNMPTQCSRTPTVKRRNNKKPVPNEDKDEKYYERRSRNNMAAKRSRDSRKRREDQVSMRANFLEKENAILRAQLATLREEANSLRQLLSQQRPIIPPQVPVQAMHKNMSQ